MHPYSVTIKRNCLVFFSPVRKHILHRLHRSGAANMHRHSELSRDNGRLGKQHPASRLPTSSTRMTSSLSSPSLIMAAVSFGQQGSKNKARLARPRRTNSAVSRKLGPLRGQPTPPPTLPTPPPMLSDSQKEKKWHKSILTRRPSSPCSHLLLLPLLPSTNTSKLNWVSGAWVVTVSMATSGLTEHKRWGRHLAMLFIPHHSQKWC